MHKGIEETKRMPLQGAGGGRLGNPALALPAAAPSPAHSLKGALPLPLLLALALLCGCSDRMDYTPVPRHAGVAEDGATVLFPERCPDWRHSAVMNHDNSAMSNFGCATAMNLGHMAANPQDLAMGRGMQGAETESSVSAVERFYSGEITKKPADSTPVTTE